MSETNEIVEETPNADYKPPFYRNRFYSYDHYNSVRKAARLFSLLKDNEILQISSNFTSDHYFKEVSEIARDNGIELTLYKPLSTDPYYWMRNGYVCKKIPIERIEKHIGACFDPSNLVE